MNLSVVLHVARYCLGVALVGANVAVWYGVWLERESAPKEVQERGWRILVVALAVEAAVGMFLFAADTALDVIQRNENAAIYAAAANAEGEAGRLGVDVKNLHGYVDNTERDVTKQLDDFKRFAIGAKTSADTAIADLAKKQAELAKARDDAVIAAENARADIAKAEDALAKEAAIRDQIIALTTPRSLSDAQRLSFIQHLAKFMSVSAAIWRSESSSPDTVPFSLELLSALQAAHWQARGVTVSHGFYGTGIMIFVRNSAPSGTEGAVTALLSELHAAHFDAGRGPTFKDENFLLQQGMAENVFDNAKPPDILIFVGTK